MPGDRTAKGQFTSIFMAGNLDFRQKLIDDFGDSFGERAQKWVQDSIHQYGFVEIEAEGLSRFGNRFQWRNGSSGYFGHDKEHTTLDTPIHLC